MVAIDESGIVRAIGPRTETGAAGFLDRAFTGGALPSASRSSPPPHADALPHFVGRNSTATNWQSAAGPARRDGMVELQELLAGVDREPVVGVGNDLRVNMVGQVELDGHP